jgi:hypothetical protein
MRCAAKWCVNDSEAGLFYGKFCMPCAQALESGDAKYGTSWIFVLTGELDAIKRTREQEADYANTCHRNREMEDALIDFVHSIDQGGVKAETILDYIYRKAYDLTNGSASAKETQP